MNTLKVAVRVLSFLLFFVTLFCKCTVVNASAQQDIQKDAKPNITHKKVKIKTLKDYRNEFIEKTDTHISKEYLGYVYDICFEYGICPELIVAMIETESSGQASVVSSSGAIGLMQIIPKWHMLRMEKLMVKDLYDPRGNILVGVDLIYELSKEYQDLPVVLMCYNEGALPELFEKINNGYVSEYATRIMNRSAELQKAKENGGEIKWETY